MARLDEEMTHDRWVRREAEKFHARLRSPSAFYDHLKPTAPETGVCYLSGLICEPAVGVLYSEVE